MSKVVSYEGLLSVGDKAKVKDITMDMGSVEGHTGEHDSIVREMLHMAGKIVTIRDVDGGKYRIEECGYNWTDGMFEGKVIDEESVKMERGFKVGDIIRAKAGIYTPYSITDQDMIRGEVVDVDEGELTVKILEHRNSHNNGDTYDVSAKYFEVIEEVKEEGAIEVANGIKVGDKVRVSVDGFCSLNDGEIVVVLALNGDGQVKEVERDNGGRYTICSQGNCHRVRDGRLIFEVVEAGAGEVVAEPKEFNGIKEGDKVIGIVPEYQGQIGTVITVDLDDEDVPFEVRWDEGGRDWTYEKDIKKYVKKERVKGAKTMKRVARPTEPKRKPVMIVDKGEVSINPMKAFTHVDEANRTVIVHIFAGEEVFTGLAKCSKEDIFDIEIGVRLATTRAMREFINASEQELIEMTY